MENGRSIRWAAKALLDSTSILAADAESQIKWLHEFHDFHDFGEDNPCFADELALHFDYAYSMSTHLVASEIIPKTTYALLCDLEMALDKMSGDENDGLWIADSLRNGKEWQSVRSIAQECLSAMEQSNLSAYQRQDNSDIKNWILASRPKTLWAGACPVVLGTAMAYDAGLLHLPSAIAALNGALLIQVGTNFANDYYDGLKGTDDENRKGPARAVASGLIAPEVMKRATILTMLLVFVPGAYILWRGGLPFLIIGIVSILSGIAYTGGPYPLAYNGLGDIFALVFFGPVAVGGTYYLQAYAIPPEVLIAGLAPGLFSVAILTVNNLRDIEGDAAAGKRTLPVRFGPGFARFEYIASLLVATIAIPVGLAFYTGAHYASTAAGLVFLIAIPAYKALYNSPDDGPVMNATLANTGKYLLIFTILFSVGWVLT